MLPHLAMKLLAIVSVLFFAACATDVSSDISKVDVVTTCEQNAAALCDRIGYGDNVHCLMSASAECSPEDYEAAHDACLREHPELSATDKCELAWR